MNVHKILQKRLRLKPQKLYYICPQIVEYYNFLCRIVSSDEAKFQVSARVNQHNCVTSGSETATEHLKLNI
jgi:hypothetical protein